MKLVKHAVEHLGIKANIEHVSDFAKFINYGVMLTPAVVINGKLKVQGKIPTLDEVERMIKEELKNK